MEPKYSELKMWHLSLTILSLFANISNLELRISLAYANNADAHFTRPTRMTSSDEISRFRQC
jgi:hypothetical protein